MQVRSFGFMGSSGLRGTGWWSGPGSGGQGRGGTASGVMPAGVGWFGEGRGKASERAGRALERHWSAGVGGGSDRDIPLVPKSSARMAETAAKVSVGSVTGSEWCWKRAREGVGSRCLGAAVSVLGGARRGGQCRGGGRRALPTSGRRIIPACAFRAKGREPSALYWLRDAGCFVRNKLFRVSGQGRILALEAYPISLQAWGGRLE